MFKGQKNFSTRLIDSSEQQNNFNTNIISGLCSSWRANHRAKFLKHTLIFFIFVKKKKKCFYQTFMHTRHQYCFILGTRANYFCHFVCMYTELINGAPLHIETCMYVLIDPCRKYVIFYVRISLAKSACSPNIIAKNIHSTCTIPTCN